jgi:hypothetical protein
LVAKVPPLLDGRNVKHAVRISRCTCGCVLLRSDDDPSVTWTSGDWESEDQVDLRCSDRGCFCHRPRIVDIRTETPLVLRNGPPEDAKETSSAH